MIRKMLGCALALALACCFSIVGATPASTDLSKPYSQFGFDMLRELRSEQPTRNVFISPTSIAVALAMTANVISEPAILSTLHANGMPLVDFNTANQALRKQIGQTTQVRLAMANAVWFPPGHPVSPQFAATLRDKYDAPVSSLDFSSPQAVIIVNAWAKKHTYGMIPHVLDTIDPEAVLLLANAVAFKGDWTMPFAPSATASHAFTTETGATVPVQMMSHQDHYAFAQAGGVKAIALPYADRSFAMYVILPKDDASLDTFVHGLTSASFDSLIGSMQARYGTIQLPRFQISYNARLDNALAKLGVRVGDVHHASFLQVDETGTKAAAVTIVEPRHMAFPEQPFTMVVDHPFLLAIRDERSGQILFLGTIANPKA